MYVVDRNTITIPLHFIYNIKSQRLYDNIEEMYDDIKEICIFINSNCIIKHIHTHIFFYYVIYVMSKFFQGNRKTLIIETRNHVKWGNPGISRNGNARKRESLIFTELRFPGRKKIGIPIFGNFFDITNIFIKFLTHIVSHMCG